jgi:hypothetical protein
MLLHHLFRNFAECGLALDQMGFSTGLGCPQLLLIVNVLGNGALSQRATAIFRPI